MVTGIFFHDLPIYKDCNGVYCSTTLTNEVFMRYYSIVDKLVVATRVYSIDIDYKSAKQEKIDLLNITFLDLPNLNNLKALFDGKFQYTKKMLKNEIVKTDLIFIRGGMIATIAADIAYKLKKPYLAECGGCAWDSYWNHSFIGKLMAPFFEIKSRKIIENAATTIYVTKNWLQEKYPTKGEVFSVSDVVLSDLSEVVLNDRLKKIEKMNRKSIVLGTTAAMAKYKGQQYVIKAMRILKKNFDIRYELVGGGNKSYLKKIAKKYGVIDRVVFKGEMTHSQVLEWLDSIDVYVQPSCAEGLPRALVEAMSRGCPAIGTEVAGIPELLRSDAVFKKKRAKACAIAIYRIMHSDLSIQANINFHKAEAYEQSRLDNDRAYAMKSYKKIALRGTN